jgi:hypothetical protein
MMRVILEPVAARGTAAAVRAVVTVTVMVVCVVRATKEVTVNVAGAVMTRISS